MYTGLLHSHSLLRYIILIVLFVSFVKALISWINKSEFGKLDDKLSFFAMLFMHLQLLVGFGLYFVSPMVMLNDFSVAMKTPAVRFYTVEHLLMMLIAIALVSIGRIASKKKTEAQAKHKTIAIYFGLTLVIIIGTVYGMMPA